MIISKTINESIDLFRIMPLERFLQMLFNRKNFLVRPSAWKDPYESIVQKSVMMIDANNMMKYDDKRWHGQCWSYNKESDAYWQIYSKGEATRSVQIKTTSDALEKTLNTTDKSCHYFLEKVQYAKPSEGEKNVMEEISSACQYKWLWGDACYSSLFNDNEFIIDGHITAAPMLLTKRDPFRYEQEVRILRFSNESQTSDIYECDIQNMADFIKEVTLDPWSPRGFDEVISDIIIKYLPESNIKVKISDLYKEVEKGLMYDPHQYYEEYRNRIKQQTI